MVLELASARGRELVVLPECVPKALVETVERCLQLFVFTIDAHSTTQAGSHPAVELVAEDVSLQHRQDADQRRGVGLGEGDGGTDRYPCPPASTLFHALSPARLAVDDVLVAG